MRSPRERGWSMDPPETGPFLIVLPARAGMVPHRDTGPPRGTRAPRASGDGPSMSPVERIGRLCSPRERGWSHRRHRPGRSSQVLPARAGMVPGAVARGAVCRGAPRASGDGPFAATSANFCVACSPRERGWSPGRRLPAPEEAVLPARAGMVPVPRPNHQPAGSTPRASGDGPIVRITSTNRSVCSPRERGWSQGQEPAGLVGAVLPARAGMVPRPASRPGPRLRAPRASGDGPPSSLTTGSTASCSPRERGWSPD